MFRFRVEFAWVSDCVSANPIMSVLAWLGPIGVGWKGCVGEMFRFCCELSDECIEMSVCGAVALVRGKGWPGGIVDCVAEELAVESCCWGVGCPSGMEDLGSLCCRF